MEQTLKQKVFYLEDEVAHLRCYLFELHKLARETVDKFVDDHENEIKLRELRIGLDCLSSVMNTANKNQQWEKCARHNPNNDNCLCSRCSYDATCVKCGKTPCYYVSVNDPFCSLDCIRHKENDNFLNLYEANGND